MKIKPVEGRLVRDPVTMLPLAAEGVEVPDYDPHWREALRWGDVEIVKAPDPAPEVHPADPLVAAVAQAEQAIVAPGAIEHADEPEPMTETAHVG